MGPVSCTGPGPGPGPGPVPVAVSISHWGGTWYLAPFNPLFLIMTYSDKSFVLFLGDGNFTFRGTFQLKLIVHRHHHCKPFFVCTRITLSAQVDTCSPQWVFRNTNLTLSSKYFKYSRHITSFSGGGDKRTYIQKCYENCSLLTNRNVFIPDTILHGHIHYLMWNLT